MRNHITPNDLPYLGGALVIGIAIGAAGAAGSFVAGPFQKKGKK